MSEADAKITIRALGPSDLPQILAICRKMHDASIYGKWPYDAGLAANNAVAHIRHDDKLIVGAFRQIESKSGSSLLVGMLAARTSKGLSCNILEAFDTMVYAPYGIPGIGGMLIRKYVDWAKEKGAKNIVIGGLGGIDNEVLEVRLKRLGFIKAGPLMKYQGE